VAAEIAKLGGEAITIGCNVAKRDELDAMFKAVTDKWGSVDVLVNNAGDLGAGLGGMWDVGVCQGGPGEGGRGMMMMNSIKAVAIALLRFCIAYKGYK